MGCSACAPSSPGGQDSCVNCLADQGYFASNSGCIYCKNLAGSTGVADSTGCVCHSSYYWNPETSTCDCNYRLNFVGGATDTCLYCPDFEGTTATATLKGCGCVSGIWNPLTQTCGGKCDTSNGIPTHSG
jgi:hypothetical protein